MAGVNPATIDRSQTGDESGGARNRRLLFLATALVMACIPSLLVVRDRWLGDPPIQTPVDSLWARLPFLRTLILPTYFGLILALYIGLLILFSFRKGGNRLSTLVQKFPHVLLVRPRRGGSQACAGGSRDPFV